MKVLTHKDFLTEYAYEPAAEPGRLESIISAIWHEVDFEEASSASEDDILAVHTKSLVREVAGSGLYNIAALAAGAAMQTAAAGMDAPSFGLIRPPGHHASSNRCWGFCYFNNMAIALEYLRSSGLIKTAHVLDFDYHFGDGTVDILEPRGFVSIHNPRQSQRKHYLAEVAARLDSIKVDVIAVSAGFDAHVDDWGKMLRTEDYREMGRMVHAACLRMGAGSFGLLEGGYNHDVLGVNVREFLRGLQGL